MAYYKQARLLLALVVIIALVIFAELPGSTLYWRELQNTGHTILFALVAVLSLILVQSSSQALLREPAKAYVAAFGIALLLAVMTELVQYLMNSDASATDVLRDFAGIASGLGLYSAYDANVQHAGINVKKNKLGIKLISTGILLASLAPLAYLSVAYVQRGNAFPVVIDLKANWTQSFLQLRNASVRPNPANELMEVTLHSGVFPGLSMIEPYPDWSTFKALGITIVSQNAEPFTVTIRIHDATHDNKYEDRFNKSFMVKPGVNSYKVQLQEIKRAPLGRKMDMQKISDITLFSAKVDKLLTFYLGPLSFE